jgi:hypothetical protein
MSHGHAKKVSKKTLPEAYAKPCGAELDRKCGTETCVKMWNRNGTENVGVAPF